MLDIFISAISTALTVYLAYIGLELTLKPPKKSDDMARTSIKRKIWIVAGLSVLATVGQAIRTHLETQDKLEPVIELSRAALADDAKSIVPNRPLAINIFYKSAHNTAHDVQFFTYPIIVGDGKKNPSDIAWAKAKIDYQRFLLTPTAGGEAPRDMELYQSSTIPSLTDEEAKGLISGKFHFYALQFVRWKNAEGWQTERKFCFTLVNAEIVNRLGIAQLQDCVGLEPK